MYVVIVGKSINGLKLVGPFYSDSMANAFGRRLKNEWRVKRVKHVSEKPFGSHSEPLEQVPGKDGLFSMLKADGVIVESGGELMLRTLHQGRFNATGLRRLADAMESSDGPSGA